MERNKLDGNGGIIGTGEYVDYPVQAVYRAIGYFGSELPEVGLRLTSAASSPTLRVASWTRTARSFPACTHTGWIKRGPVGLIGSTKC